MRIKNTMNKKFSIYLFSLLAIFFYKRITIEAQSQADKKPIKYKKSRVLQKKLQKMAEVYEALS